MKTDENADAADDMFPSTLAIMLTPVLWIWEGFALSKLWAWFVVPQFDVKPLSLGVAIGLMVVGWGLIGFPTYGRGLYEEMQKKTSGKAHLAEVCLQFLVPGMALFVGYIGLCLS